MIALSVDDNDLVWFRIDGSGRLFLNATVFDDRNLLLLVIRENELTYRTATWDIEFHARTLIVREAARRILFEIEFIPPREVVISRARLPDQLKSQCLIVGDCGRVGGRPRN